MSKYTTEQINFIEDSLELYTDNDLEQLYKDSINEVYGPAQIGGYEYDHARAFETIDPTAYRIGLVEYLDSLMESYTEYRPGYYVSTYELNALLTE
jgi:hypothetical protein